MKMYVIALTMGLIVGIFYGVFHVRSPAPPAIALLGLLGILLGEQIPPLLRHVFSPAPSTSAWHEQVKPHVFGQLPSGASTGEGKP